MDEFGVALVGGNVWTTKPQRFSKVQSAKEAQAPSRSSHFVPSEIFVVQAPYVTLLVTFFGRW